MTALPLPACARVQASGRRIPRLFERKTDGGAALAGLQPHIRIASNHPRPRAGRRAPRARGGWSESDKARARARAGQAGTSAPAVLDAGLSASAHAPAPAAPTLAMATVLPCLPNDAAPARLSRALTPPPAEKRERESTRTYSSRNITPTSPWLSLRASCGWRPARIGRVRGKPPACSGGRQLSLRRTRPPPSVARLHLHLPAVASSFFRKIFDTFHRGRLANRSQSPVAPKHGWFWAPVYRMRRRRRTRARARTRFRLNRRRSRACRAQEGGGLAFSSPFWCC